MKLRLTPIAPPWPSSARLACQGTIIPGDFATVQGPDDLRRTRDCWYDG